jgi:preprotein translocase SecE subunit
MAKTRAQRKAEKRRRQQAQQDRQPGRPGDESRAQHDTQEGVSGEVAEVEAVIETGARTEDYGEHVTEREGPDAAQARAAVPGVTPEPVAPEPLEAPAPSRADVGQPDAAPAEAKESRRERRAREKEERRRSQAKDLQKSQPRKDGLTEKRRGPVTGFIASCWAELKKVQWPDRDTLVQASAVTIIFVAVMAAYLGALDAAFNFLIKQII